MKYFATLILYISLICSAMAQEPGSRRALSLEDCINVALSKNYDIQLSRHQISSANAQLTGAFGSYLPSVDFSLGYQRDLNPKEASTAYIFGQIVPIPAAKPNSYNMQAYASYSIFDGFRREAQYSASQSNLDAAYSGAKQTIEDVKIEVTRRFIKVARYAQLVRIRQENLELGKKELERAQAQFDAGVLPITAVLSQEAELGQREYDLVNSLNDMNMAKSDLLTVMGLTPDAQMEFQEKSIPSTVKDDEVVEFRKDIGSYNAVVATAFKNRHDYAYSDFSIKAAESIVSQSYAGYMPRLFAQGGWTWSNNEWSGFNEFGRSYLGLNLSIPIFENFQTNASIQTANLQLEQRRIEQMRIEQGIRQQIQNGFLYLESAEKQLDITRRALIAAERNYESSRERFHIGAAGITEYLTANNQLISAQINRVTAVYAYIQAQRELTYAAGLLK